MISFYNIVLLGGARLHGGISDPILSSLRVFINAHSRSIVSSVYDSLQHPYIILAKNGPTKTYLLYMYLSSLTEWSHSLAWFERPADNRKVLCSNHNGTTKVFRPWKIAQQMCICSSDSSSFFCRRILWGSCCTKGCRTVI